MSNDDNNNDSKKQPEVGTLTTQIGTDGTHVGINMGNGFSIDTRDGGLGLNIAPGVSIDLTGGFGK